MINRPVPDPIVSTFSDDEEMAELIGEFVNELPERVEAFQRAVRQESWSDLRRLAHQLKGAAPSYGFPDIGAAAGRVEGLAERPAGLERVAAAVDELLSLCRRASGPEAV